MSNRTATAAPAGRNPRRYAIWIILLGWHVARTAPALACAPGFLTDPLWREAYAAGLSPQQAFSTHPKRWEA